MEHVAPGLHGTQRSLAKLERWSLGILLAFGALNAVAGGLFGLSGAKGVPIEWLSGSPFRDYFVPGFFLLVVVGGSLLAAAVAVLTNARVARAAAMAAGCVLLGWIAVQVAIIGYVSWMQPTTAAAGVLVLALATTLPRTGRAAQATARAFGAFYAATARHPTRAFEALRRDPRNLRLGAYALLSNAALYTLVYVFLVMAHGRPVALRPWLAIDAEAYYRWDVFLFAPSAVMGWLLAGGVAQLLARRFGGTATFEDTLAALGFATAIASWCTLAHDLITSALGAFGVLDQRAYEDAMSSPTPSRALIWTLMIAYAAAFVALYTIAVASTHRIGRARACVTGVVAFAAYQGILLIFNR